MLSDGAKLIPKERNAGAKRKKFHKTQYGLRVVFCESNLDDLLLSGYAAIQRKELCANSAQRKKVCDRQI
jgi:hypothetical protein